MILELDVGNTRVKWRIVDQAGITAAVGTHIDSIENLVEYHRDKTFKRVRISSVRTAATNVCLDLCIQRYLGVIPEFAQSLRKFGGVTSAYWQAEKLGVDRWMAMLAGRQRLPGRAFVVVDAGSALTIDFVDKNGLHSGGYIVPGLRLQLGSLSQGTAIAFSEDGCWSELAPGRDTEHAIRSGILGMVCHWVHSVVGPQNKAGVNVLITGGDAAVLATELLKMGLQLEHVPDLVLDGLRVALP